MTSSSEILAELMGQKRLLYSHRNDPVSATMHKQTKGYIQKNIEDVGAFHCPWRANPYETAFGLKIEINNHMTVGLLVLKNGSGDVVGITDLRPEPFCMNLMQFQAAESYSATKVTK